MWNSATARENTQGADSSTWATSGSLPSLERPADLSPSLERPAGLSPSLERPVDLSPLLERPADLCLRLRDQRTSPLCLRDQWTSPLRFRDQWTSPLRLRDQWTSPLCLSDQRISAFSPKLQILYCLSSPMNTPLHPRIFLLVAGYRNLHTSGFFPVISWSYRRTEISVTRSIGNKSYSLSCDPLCWSYLATALNLLSSSSPAKLLYDKVSRTLLSVQADYNTAVVCVNSTRFFFPSSQVPLPNHWWLYRAHQLQLVSPSLSCCILLSLLLFIAVFQWRLSDSKSPQVFRTLLSILAVLNNVVVWMVSTRPPTSKSSSSFRNPLVTVLNAPITIGIIVTFMFHSFFNSLARSKYLSLFSHSFSFNLWSAGTVKSTILQFLSFFFFVDYYYVWFLAEIRWSVCMSKSHRNLCVIFSRTGPALYICHLLVWSKLHFLHISQCITLPTQSSLHSLLIWLMVSSLSPHSLIIIIIIYSFRVFHISVSWWS